jgi:hypothetical protein
MCNVYLRKTIKARNVIGKYNYNSIKESYKL